MTAPAAPQQGSARNVAGSTCGGPVAHGRSRHLSSALSRRLPTTLRGPVSVKQLYEHGDLPGGSRSRPADRRSPRLLSAATMSSNRRFVRGEWTQLGHQSEAWAVARSHQGAGHRRSRQSRADSTHPFTSFGHRLDRRVIDRIDNRTRRNLGRVSRIRVPTLSMQTATPQRGRVAGKFARSTASARSESARRARQRSDQTPSVSGRRASVSESTMPRARVRHEKTTPGRARRHE